MEYNDKLYGKQEINEPWALDIISHPDFQRLKGVGQYGYIEPYYPENKNSRFDHSIGVFLLLRKYGLSKKEQLAGLLHDISHTVFSHCIDYALDKQTAEFQTYQDDHHGEYVKSSSILGVLEKHGFKIDDVILYKNYKALELDLPDLCADRIDYVLRDAIGFGVIEKEKAADFFKRLILKNNTWVFKDIVGAMSFAQLFKKMNNDFYSSPWAGNMHSTVGSYVSYALKKGYINKTDLYVTEKEFIRKINKNKNDQELQKLWKMMNEPEFSLDKNNYDVVVKTKSRIVDPWLMVYGEKKRFSQVDKTWQEVIEKEILPKEYFIKYNT